MLGCGDQNTLLHQTGRVADSGYVAADGLDFKTVEIVAPEDDAGIRGGRKDAKGNVGSGM
jgi:hypothetical protein